MSHCSRPNTHACMHPLTSAAVCLCPPARRPGREGCPRGRCGSEEEPRGGWQWQWQCRQQRSGRLSSLLLHAQDRRTQDSPQRRIARAHAVALERWGRGRCTAVFTRPTRQRQRAGKRAIWKRWGSRNQAQAQRIGIHQTSVGQPDASPCRRCACRQSLADASRPLFAALVHQVPHPCCSSMTPRRSPASTEARWCRARPSARFVRTITRRRRRLAHPATDSFDSQPCARGAHAHCPFDIYGGSHTSARL